MALTRAKLIELIEAGEFDEYLGGDTTELEERVDTLDAHVTQLSNPNILINPDFQVWQRGASFSGVGYTADRWYSDNPSISSVSKSGNQIKLQKDTTSGWGNLCQYLESPSKYSNKTYTLSVKKDASTLPIIIGADYYRGGVRTILKETSVAADTQTRHTSFETGALWDSDLLRVYIVLGNTETGEAKIDWIKLEEGIVATPHVPRTFAEELAMCQRYFVKVQWSRYGVTTLWTNTIDFTIPTGAEMRTAPSLVGQWYVGSAVGVKQTGFAFSGIGSGPGFAAYRATKTAHGLTGLPSFVPDVDITPICGLDAEIYP